MKLRIKGNSIRLRVTQKELEKLRTEGSYQEKTLFPNGAIFSYSLSVVDVEESTAEFSDGAIKVYIPTRKAQKWFDNEQEIGIYAEQQGLQIIVEKDFRCLVPRVEEDSDAFPHPKEKIQSC